MLNDITIGLIWVDARYSIIIKNTTKWYRNVFSLVKADSILLFFTYNNYNYCVFPYNCTYIWLYKES